MARTSKGNNILDGGFVCLPLLAVGLFLGGLFLSSYGEDKKGRPFRPALVNGGLWLSGCGLVLLFLSGFWSGL